MTTYAHIGDAHLALRPSAHFDLGRSREIYDVDSLARTVGDRLNDHKSLRVRMDIKLEQRDLLAGQGYLDDVLILRLTNLALQSSPNVRIDERRLLLVLLALKPFLNAEQMNVSHRPDALARRDDGVVWLLLRQTDPAYLFLRDRLDSFQLQSHILGGKVFGGVD